MSSLLFAYSVFSSLMEYVEITLRLKAFEFMINSITGLWFRKSLLVHFFPVHVSVDYRLRWCGLVFLPFGSCNQVDSS